MNILVCLKQVPDTAKVKFNRETNTLDRTGVENIMNPYDRQALEVALCLKDKEGAKVTVLTMGLPQATDILKEAIAMGADDGVLLSDRVLGGSDTLATSLALAAAVNIWRVRPRTLRQAGSRRRYCTGWSGNGRASGNSSDYRRSEPEL